MDDKNIPLNTFYTSLFFNITLVLYESADIDECIDRKPDYRCANDAICQNTEGNYTCICPPDFSGNGTVCNRDNPQRITHNIFFVIGTFLDFFQIGTNFLITNYIHRPKMSNKVNIFLYRCYCRGCFCDYYCFWLVIYCVPTEKDVKDEEEVFSGKWWISSTKATYKERGIKS